MAAFACALHASGAPAHRLEASVERLCAALDVPLTVHATPTALYLAAPGGVQMLRVRPEEVRLDRLVALDRLGARVLSGDLSPAAARVALDAVLAEPARFGRLERLIAFGAIAASAAVLFGGGAWDVWASAIVGLAVGGVAVGLADGPAGRLAGMLSGALAVILAGLLSRVAPVTPDVVALASLVVMVPGFALTVAMVELATNNLSAGTARLAGAGVSFLELGLGVTVGLEAARLLPGAAVPAGPALVGVASSAVAVAVAGVGLVVLFQARRRDLVPVVAVAWLAFFGGGAATATLGLLPGALVGALMVGVVSNLHSRWRRLPASLTLVPGLLLLVPGTRGLSSLQAFAARQTLDGVEAAAFTLLIAAALVGGLLISQILVPPRTDL